jgi:hypothetical protein
MNLTADRTHRLVWWGVGAIVVIVAAQITGHLIDTGIYSLRVNALDSGLDSSIFGVVSSLILVAAAAAGVAAGLVSRQRWPGMCGVALAPYAALSLLEVPQTTGGVIVVLPILAFVLIGLWRASDDQPATVARLLRSGAALLVLSFVLHVAVPVGFRRLGVAAGSWPYEIKVALKMASEIAGFGVVAVGFGAIVSEHAARGAPRVAAA